MKAIVFVIMATISANARENVEWTRLLDAIAEVESSNGANMVNAKEDAWGWFQMRRLARLDANGYLGTSYPREALVDRAIATQLFAAYVHKYRRKWSTTDEVVHLWHLGPDWRNRLHLDRGYLSKVKRALRRRRENDEGRR